jgi:hypothetical protein
MYKYFDGETVQSVENDFQVPDWAQHENEALRDALGAIILGITRVSSAVEDDGMGGCYMPPAEGAACARLEKLLDALHSTYPQELTDQLWEAMAS